MRGRKLSSARDRRVHSSGDEDPSEDEPLSIDEVNTLNSNYNVPRDLAFSPHCQIPRDPRQFPVQACSQHSASTNPSAETKGSKIYAFVPGYTPSAGSPLEQPQSMNRYGRSEDNLPHDIAYHNANDYPNPPRRRYLVDLIKNDWKNTPDTPSSSLAPTSSHDLEAPTWVQVCFAPRVQRSVLGFVILFFLVWGNWSTWIGTRWGESDILKTSAKERMQNSEGWFGENRRPEFLDMVHIGTLDEKLLPGQEHERRLIVIGDVHGCSDERASAFCSRPLRLHTLGILAHILAVTALLAVVQYEADNDHIIFTGDMISKGPSSAAVVDLAISAHASCVRGNHEDRVLLTHRDLSAHSTSSSMKKMKTKPAPPGPGIPQDTNIPDNEDILDLNESSDEVQEVLARLDSMDRHQARQLNEEHVKYLSQCPVILAVGPIAGMGDVHVVHAGLVPGVGLERQDPLGVMHMRTIDPDTHVPSSTRTGTAWYKVGQRPHSLHDLPFEIVLTACLLSFGTNTNPCSPPKTVARSSTATILAAACNFGNTAKASIPGASKAGSYLHSSSAGRRISRSPRSSVWTARTTGSWKRILSPTPRRGSCCKAKTGRLCTILHLPISYRCVHTERH